MFMCKKFINELIFANPWNHSYIFEKSTLYVFKVWVIYVMCSNLFSDSVATCLKYLLPVGTYHGISLDTFIYTPSQPLPHTTI